MNELLGGGFGVVVILFLLALAIFGTKDKLSELIAETKKTNEQLSALRSEVAVLKGNDKPIINASR